MTSTSDTSTAVDDPTRTNEPMADASRRRVALVAGFGLLVMALLAPFALFGVRNCPFCPAVAILASMYS